MQKKGISFYEVYDLLAIRIVIKPKPDISEKQQCFAVLATVTDIYHPKQERIRDWITMPKANGYESLHVTVMGKQGKWVEVQIRTERMDEVAERGFAAHYRYKDISVFESELEDWIGRIREQIKIPDVDTLEFLEDFKLNLFTNEINVYTPVGDMITMPVNSTVIDFAYEIHTMLGNKCIGAKINQKLVPVSHKLQNSDQVEILTSENQTPNIEWLKFAVSAKARTKIKDAFRLEKKKHIELGKEKVEEAFRLINTPITSNNLRKVIAHFNLNNKDQLYSYVGMGFLEIGNLNEVLGRKLENKWIKYWNITFKRKKKEIPEDMENDDAVKGKRKIDKKKTFILDNEPDETAYSLAICCNPIPGEKVVGFLSADDHVIIHKTGCHEIERLIISQGERIIVAEWTKSRKQAFLSRIKLSGIDRLGIVSDVTSVVSIELNINMRSVKFETNDSIFEGELFIYVHSTDDLDKLILRLKKIKGIHTVKRIENLHD
jgi:GTP pyrophosphokinase